MAAPQRLTDSFLAVVVTKYPIKKLVDADAPILVRVCLYQQRVYPCLIPFARIQSLHDLCKLSSLNFEFQVRLLRWTLTFAPAEDLGSSVFCEQGLHLMVQLSNDISDGQTQPPWHIPLVHQRLRHIPWLLCRCRWQRTLESHPRSRRVCSKSRKYFQKRVIGTTFGRTLCTSAKAASHVRCCLIMR